MQHRLKRPCSECPFRKASPPGYLGPWEGPEEIHGVVMAEVPFACHLTVNSPEDYADLMKPEDQGGCSLDESTIEGLIACDSSRCFGALLYMKKAGKLPRDPETSTVLQTVGPELLDRILSVPEFFTHHAPRPPFTR